MQNDKKQFLNGIAGKLAILLGGAVAATGVNALPLTAVAPLHETEHYHLRWSPPDAGAETHPEAAK